MGDSSTATTADPAGSDGDAAAWKDRLAAQVAATPTPHCAAHFLTKFENQGEDKRLSPLLASRANGSSRGERCLMVSKKHSGSLLMAPPFYSKNATANKFARLGAITMHAYMCGAWNEPRDRPATFLRWWADAEARGLCYSFELVVPRALGDHGATPAAAYLVLTTVAQTKEDITASSSSSSSGGGTAAAAPVTSAAAAVSCRLRR